MYGKEKEDVQRPTDEAEANDAGNQPAPVTEPQGWCSPEFPTGCVLDNDQK